VERVLGRGTVAMARLAGAPMLRFFTRPLASRRVGASFARRAAGTVRHRALNTRRGWDCHVSGLESDPPIRPGHYRRWIGRLEAIERVAAAHDIGPLVLFQSSVYDTDNGALLRALHIGAGRHCGLSVADSS
jgi:hypothetical protein